MAAQAPDAVILDLMRRARGDDSGLLNEAIGLLQAHPVDPRIWALVLHKIRLAGDPRPEISARATEIARRSEPFRAALISSLLALRDPSVALALLPADPALEEQALRAQARWMAGDYDRALADFEQVAATVPEAEIAAVRLGRARIDLGRIEEAVAGLNAFLDRQGGSVECEFLLALAAHRGNLWAETERTLQGLVARAPEHRLIRSALWQLRALRGAPDPAEGLVGFPANPPEAAYRDSVQELDQVDADRWLPFQYRVLDAAIDAAGDGLVVECGVFHGRSIRHLAARRSDPIHGFDSFEGLPKAWNPDEPAGSYSTEGRLPAVPDHVQLHRGWFDQTLAPFVEQHRDAHLALLHVDCDLYSSTQTVLEAFHPLIGSGTVIVFDDFFGYPGFQAHEWQAWQEYGQGHQPGFQWLALTLVGRVAALRID